MEDGIFNLTYQFEKPLLIKGYILETANDNAGNDPKDWRINCWNIEKCYEQDIHVVKDEEPRDRWVEKEYHIDEKLEDIWTTSI